ncbi:helix-turn-helix domain-containing protein [Planococcus halotolerans]|uniref:XRE family transcriptional regulator n=1 Tax=Planococcus halotolerans TaxID=2233542 RepID=A0A365KKF7_9BACL|nr:helix-turn-helix transcriptional regulator [Planococcus halotolerans]RAZ73600.1 XRE family transcriptional regulator [Planococcus halotolerans]
MESLDLTFIKNRRNQLAKTLQDMADSMEMKNASTYMKYENGTYAFKAEQLPQLAKVLECKISDFFNSGVAKTEIKMKKHAAV